MHKLQPNLDLTPVQYTWLAELGVDTTWLKLSKSRAPTKAQSTTPAALQSTVRPDTSASAVPKIADLAKAPPQSSSVIAPQRVAAHIDTWPALEQAISACQACERYQQRGRVVAGSGVARRHVSYFMVGEQPSLEDDASGQAFQGNAGELLQAMLQHARWPDAADMYFSYALKCRAIAGRAPLQSELDACQPWLRQQIELLEPQNIILLGRVAAQALLGDARDFEALRGQVHSYTTAGGRQIPVWVSYLPSSLLVHSGLKAQAWRDFMAIAQALAEQPDVDKGLGS